MLYYRVVTIITSIGSESSALETLSSAFAVGTLRLQTSLYSGVLV